MEIEPWSDSLDWIDRIYNPDNISALEPKKDSFNTRPRSPPVGRIITDTSSCLSPLGRKTVTMNFKRAESERKRQRSEYSSSVMEARKRGAGRRALSPEDVRKRKQRRKKRRAMSEENTLSSSSSSSGERRFLPWWASGPTWVPGLGGRKDAGASGSLGLAEKFIVDEKKLFEITNTSDRKKMGQAGQLIYLKRENHELLGTQFQQDDTGRLWILVIFFKGSISFTYREQDAVRSACGETFSDMEVVVNFFETEAERKACGAPCMTQVVVKMVKEEAITSGSLIYEPK
jgi:hypothetical protein